MRIRDPDAKAKAGADRRAEGLAAAHSGNIHRAFEIAAVQIRVIMSEWTWID